MVGKSTAWVALNRGVEIRVREFEVSAEKMGIAPGPIRNFVCRPYLQGEVKVGHRLIIVAFGKAVVCELEEGPDREVSRLLIATLRYAFDPSGPRQTDQQ